MITDMRGSERTRSVIELKRKCVSRKESDKAPRLK